MIIVYMTGGLGNQFFQYAAGKNLANKWNTELKLDKTWYETNPSIPYVLNQFNIKESFATNEEIQYLKNLFPNNQFGKENGSQAFRPEFFSYPNDVYIHGCWESERYFADISNIVRQEYTLKHPLGKAAQHWKKKISDAECSVSLHFRHGDFICDPRFSPNRIIFAILPFDYYHECINHLKQQYRNLTLFVFSNNLQWVKENFHPDVPMEFVEGDGLQDFEELWLMSLCNHNIIANSTFSWWGAWLNQNPDKKIFVPIPTSFFGTNNHYRFFLPERNENSPFQSDRWIRVPFDLNKQPDIMMRPIFSLLLVVNNDVATLGETLGSILAQDYKFYELIIIDNASTDGSGKICRQVANANDKVTLIKLWNKVSDGAAYNKAIDIAQGDFVLFFKNNDRVLSNALTSLYSVNGRPRVDVVNSFVWFREDERGGISIAGRKFGLEVDAAFRGLQGELRGKFDKPTLFKIFATNEVATPLATKMFKREFLADKQIRFNEQSGNDSERLFAIDAMLKADEMIFTPQVFYIAPRK